MAKAKKQKFVSPAGEAVYPYLNKPDSADINGQPQTPAFKCRLRLGAESAEGIKLRGIIDGLVDAAWDERFEDLAPKYKKVAEKVYPYEEELDDAGEPTGTLLFNFKQNASLKLKSGEIVNVKIDLFDATKKRITSNVGGGSIVKIAFTHRTYGMVSGKQFNIGISLDFTGVQVLELVEFGGGSADGYGFGEEDDYDGVDDAPVDNDDDTAGTEDGEDDDF